MRDQRRVAAALAAAAAMACATACSGQSSADPQPSMLLPTTPLPIVTQAPTPTPSSSGPISTDPPVTKSMPTSSPTLPVPGGSGPAATAAKASWTAMWTDVQKASSSGDATLLPRHATGAALQLIQKSFSLQQQRHFRLTGSAVTAPLVVQQGSGYVLMRDCFSSLRIVDNVTRKDLADKSSATLTNVGVARQADGAWKVYDYGGVPDGRGAAQTCAA